MGAPSRLFRCQVAVRTTHPFCGTLPLGDKCKLIREVVKITAIKKILGVAFLIKPDETKTHLLRPENGTVIRMEDN